MLICVDPVGGGVGVVIGMSPAKAETEKTHVKAIAITNRFIRFSPLILSDAKSRTTKRE